MNRITVLVFILLIGSARAQEPVSLFEAVSETLGSRYYDEAFRNERLPLLTGLYRPLASRARNPAQERAVIHSFLSKIPVSHLALYSEATFEKMRGELSNRKSPTYGFSLVERDGMLFADKILEGGPAAKAGLLRWDRIVELNGVNPKHSKALDWRTDDAFLPDPAIHQLLCENGAKIDLFVERKPGESLSLNIRASRYSAYQAAKASSRVFTRKGKKIGYLHFWYIHHKGPAELISKSVKDDFKDCDGLVLDLRGRGGNASTVNKMISVLKRDWSPRPLVALVDSETRSAKEIIAHRIQSGWLGLVVGERTAGAVIPATFARVGSDAVLMFPSFSLGRYTELLEGVGVSPDVPVNDAGPYSAGADPILEAGIDALARGYRRL